MERCGKSKVRLSKCRKGSRYVGSAVCNGAKAGVSFGVSFSKASINGQCTVVEIRCRGCAYCRLVFMERKGRPSGLVSNNTL